MEGAEARGVDGIRIPVVRAAGGQLTPLPSREGAACGREGAGLLARGGCRSPSREVPSQWRARGL